jgi:hypothetical protein
LVQHDFVKYRSVRYAILLGTAREEWRVAIYPVPNQLPKERTVAGTREDAEIKARSMIDAWLKKRPALKRRNNARMRSNGDSIQKDNHDG